MTCRSLCLSIASFFFLSVGTLGAEYPAFTFPQLASGQGLTCEIVLTNPGSQIVHGTVYFFDSSGEPLSVPLGESSVDSWEFTLPAGGSVTTTTGSAETLAVGYAEVKVDRLDSRVAGSLVYRLGDHELSVPGGSLVTQGHIFVDQGPEGDTGVAVANSSDEVLHLRLLALDSAGNPLASKEREVPAREKFAELVYQVLDGLPAEFTGSLHLVGDRGFTMIGLRQRTSGALSTLSCSSRALESSVPLRFIASTDQGMMHVTADGQVTKVMDRHAYALDVYDSNVYVGRGTKVEVYDSAYRLIRTIEVDEGIWFLRLKILPGERMALIDNEADEINIVDFKGQLLASVAMPPNGKLQNIYPAVIGGDLIVSETGNGQLFLVDLRTYEGKILRDFSSEAAGNLGPLAYADGFYYLSVGGERIYRFAENGPAALVATLSEHNITGMKIVDGVAYVVTNSGGSLLAVDLQSGETQSLATGLNQPKALSFAPGTAR